MLRPCYRFLAYQLKFLLITILMLSWIRHSPGTIHFWIMQRGCWQGWTCPTCESGVRSAAESPCMQSDVFRVDVVTSSFHRAVLKLLCNCREARHRPDDDGAASGAVHQALAVLQPAEVASHAVEGTSASCVGHCQSETRKSVPCTKTIHFSATDDRRGRWLLLIAVVGAGPSPLQQHERAQFTTLQPATPVASPARLALGAEQPSTKRHVATVRPTCRMIPHVSLFAVLVEAHLQGLLKAQHTLVCCGVRCPLACK